MKYIILVSLAVGLVLPSLALAGSTANPASNVGKENIGFTFEIENQVKTVDKDQTTSKRWLGKVIWGATDRLDFYGKLGASDLRVAVADARDFRGKRAMTWGGGARCMVARTEKPKIATYVDVQMLSFSNNGTFSGVSEGCSYEATRHYKWNEVQLSFFGVWQREAFAPYAGFGLTNVFGSVKQDVYSLECGQAHQPAHDFREDGIPELILGIDLSLGGTGNLSGEIRYGEDEDISFFIGASELWHVK